MVVIVEDSGLELSTGKALLEGDEYEDEDQYEDIDEEEDEEVIPTQEAKWYSKLAASMHSLLPSSFSAMALRTYTFVASAAWVVTTSLIMVGLPILYAYDREQNGQFDAKP